MAAAHAGVWATAGVHPHEASDGIDGLEALLAEPEVVAVGECGLDYHYDHSPRDAQREVFAAQIALAHAHDLALVIHTREAWDDTFDVLAAEGVPDAHRVPLLHRRPRRGPPLPRPRRLPVLQRHRHVQDGRRRPRRRRALPARPAAGRDRRAVPRAGARTGASRTARRWCRWWARRWPRSRAGRSTRSPRPRWDNATAPLPAPAAARPAVTHTRTQVTALLEAHDLGPSRALGQNFVVDPNTVRRIARLAGVGPGDPWWRSAPGSGSLTLALAETGAVGDRRRDRPPPLPVLARGGRAGSTCTVVEGDAMRARLGRAARRRTTGGPWWPTCPYNVATPLVLDLLDGVPAIERMLVMVQREAGERLAAGAGLAAYGIPSVKVALLGHGPARRQGRARRVPAPAPGRLGAGRDRPPRRAGHRRRPRAAVRAGASRVRPAPQDAAPVAGRAGRRPSAFEAAGIDPEARPERLSVEDWGRLADAWSPARPPWPADRDAVRAARRRSPYDRRCRPSSSPRPS